MFTLTTEHLKKAAREYYDKGLLTAQQPGATHHEASCKCVYDDRHGHRCAIGAALPDDLIKEILEQGLEGRNVYRLQAQNILTLENESYAIKLQRAHDYWCDNTNDPQVAEGKFLKILYEEPKLDNEQVST